MRPLRLAVSTFAIGLCAVTAAHAAPGHASSNAGDLAIAKRVAFRVADFPAGWSQVPTQSKDTGCFTGPAKKSAPTAFVLSKRFSSGANGTQASQFIVVYASHARAQHALTAVTAAPAFSCYRAKLAALMAASGVKLDSFAGGPLSFDPIGGVVRTYRYKAVVSKGGQSDALFIDSIFALRGRVLVSSGFTQQSSEPDVQTEHSVLAHVAARMPGAPA